MKDQKTFMRFAFLMGAFLLFSLNAQSQAIPFGESGTEIFGAHTVYSDCTGEDVYFPDGINHYSVHGVVKPNGTVKTHFHFNWNLVGEGVDSGVTYQCISPYNEKSIETEAGVEGSFWFIQHMFSHGGGQGSNILFTVNATYIVDTEGNFSITSWEQDFHCNGE